jgi:hypothetical protein
LIALPTQAMLEEAAPGAVEILAPDAFVARIVANVVPPGSGSGP